MAYGLKYFAQYKDVAGVLREIRFLKEGYTGESTKWLTESAAVVRSQGASDQFFGRMVVTSQARINLFLEEQYDLTEFVYDRRTIMCQLLIVGVGGDADKIVWSGWVEPWDAARDWQKPPYRVNLVASCGLAQLSKKKYVNKETVFKKTGLKIIRECLALIGSELDLRVSTHMYENSWTGDSRLGLNSFEINTARYYNQDGEALKCEEIVLDILNKFNAELTQWDNRWVIRSIVDHAAGFDLTYLELPFIDGGELKPAAPWPATYTINDVDAFSEAGGQIRVLAPLNKYRTEVDFGSQTPYFENGNMVLWTDDGLVGWDFSNMPKGNPGWERFHLGGDPEAASVLKINGVAPGPYQKKRKKKLGQVLMAVGATVIGAAGALLTLKNKYQDVEPTEWIETPAGKITDGDKILKVSFNYETPPLCGDIIIAIRFPHLRTPVRNHWGWWSTNQNYIPYDEFKFVIVPAVNYGDLTNKGNIDVSGNPNYPNGTNSAGFNWAYTITGVPSGQVRRIGGVSGVPVENGDVIISRVSNPGGTQAAVGDYWELISIRNNPKRGTFEAEIGIDFAKLLASNDPDKSLPYQEVFLRFYKISHADGKTGDWYKIYNVGGALEGFVAQDSASKYATTLERGSKTDEEAEKINLITGDYNPWYSGSLTIPGSSENTKSWRRRPNLNEELSVYRAMMLDRLCMTSLPLTVAEGNLFLKNTAGDLSYLNTLLLHDMGGKRMRIVRFSYNDYLRSASVTGIEANYQEIPVDELRQDSYIPGSRQLNTVPGQGDGVYPTKQDSSNGRLSAEDIPPSNEDLANAVNESGRLGSLFDFTGGGLEFIVGEEGEDSVDLTVSVSEIFTEINDDQEEEDIFDIKTLVFELTEKPSWVSEIEIDEDLVLTATAKAPKSGTFYLYYDVTDPESGLVFPIKIPILVEASETFAESWPPTFDPITLTFTVGEESEQKALISDYMDADHAAAEGYTFKLLNSIPWMIGRSIVNMELSVTGKPTEVGSSDMVWQITDSISRTYIFYVTLEAIAAATVTGKVLNTTSGVVEIGDLPGSFAVPTRFDASFRILGPHTGYTATLKGGGLLGDYVDEARDIDFTESADGTYRIYGSTGELAETGQYALQVVVKRGLTLSEPVLLDLTLTDNDYLDLVQNAFLSDGIPVSYINPNGTSVFENNGVEIWNLTSEVDGPEFDKVTLKLYSDSGILLKTEVHDLALSTTYGVFLLDLTPVLRAAGKYKLVTELELVDDLVFISSVRFEVAGVNDDGCCKGYAVNLGDGVNTDYTITHNLNTRDVRVSFIRNTDGNSVHVAWRVIDLNSVLVGFSARAIPSTNLYRALVVPV